MPRTTGAGPILGGLAFALGFAGVWHLWWLVIASALGIWAAIIFRASNDDAEFCLPAGEVEKIENQRFEALAKASRTETENPAPYSTQPLPESLT